MGLTRCYKTSFFTFISVTHQYCIETAECIKLIFVTEATVEESTADALLDAIRA